MPRTTRTLLLASLLVAASLWLTPSAGAQSLSPRFGLGFNTMVSTADGVGVGFRARASAPVNADLSLAVDLGFTGFVLQGRDNGVYVFDPQASVIVNLPIRGSQLTYVIGGLGAYVPLEEIDDGESGPTLHLGLGRVHQLRETSLFYEINPALIIGQESVDLAVPLRLGIIF